MNNSWHKPSVTQQGWAFVEAISLATQLGRLPAILVATV